MTKRDVNVAAKHKNTSHLTGRNTALSTYENSISNNAIYYVSSIFFNKRHNTIKFSNLEDAQEMASRMSKAANNGRKGIVYAVDCHNQSVFVSSHD